MASKTSCKVSSTAIVTCLPFTVNVPAVTARENEASSSTTPETSDVVLRDPPMLEVPNWTAAVASWLMLIL